MSYQLHDRSIPDVSLSTFSGVLSFAPVELPPLSMPDKTTPNINISAFVPKPQSKVTESPSAFYLRQFGGATSNAAMTQAVEQLTIQDAPTNSSRPVSQSLLDFNTTLEDIPPSSPMDKVKKSSILSLFESVDSDYPTPPATPAAVAPLPPIPASVTVSLAEEYSFTQKGTSFEQFQCSGKLSSEVNTSVTAGCNLSLHLIDTSSHIADVSPLNNHISITPPDIFSTYHDRYTISTTAIPASPSTFLAAYTTKPAVKPALLRARSITAKKDNVVKISIQVQLNTLFPLPLENVQVKVALSSITNHTNVRSKPIGQYDAASKVITWNCGSQCSTKNANINMDLLIEQTDEVPLPAAVPILLTATTPSAISGIAVACHELKCTDEKINFEVKCASNAVTRIKFKCVV